MAHPLLLEYLSDKKDSWLKLRTKSPDDEPELLAQANVKLAIFAHPPKMFRTQEYVTFTLVATNIFILLH